MTICQGHTIEAKRSKSGLLRAYVDGKLDRSIEPAKYKGVLYRRVKAKYRLVWSQTGQAALPGLVKNS